jgi:hypothetical protein
MKATDLVNQESGGNVTLLTIAGFMLIGAFELFQKVAGNGWEIGAQFYVAVILLVLSMVVMLFRAWWIKHYGTEPISVDIEATKALIRTVLTSSISFLEIAILTAESMSLPADKIELLKKQKAALEAQLALLGPAPGS